MLRYNGTRKGSCGAGKQKHDGCDMVAFKNNKVRVRRMKMLGNKEVANCLQGHNSSQPQAGSTLTKVSTWLHYTQYSLYNTFIAYVYLKLFQIKLRLNFFNICNRFTTNISWTLQNVKIAVSATQVEITWVDIINFIRKCISV